MKWCLTKESGKKEIRWSEEKDAIEGVILCLIRHSLPEQLNTGLCLLILWGAHLQVHARARAHTLAIFGEIKFAAEKLLIVGNPHEYKVRESSD